MKNTMLKILVLVFFLPCASGCASGANVSRGQGAVTLQVFYDELAPYGTWISYESYGYVWVPNAGPGFMPYATNGYWVVTDYGNTWVSDYAWGWAPFHYGRWMYDDYYGWMWVPDTEWAPAWVVWRSGYGYYGWAPLMPGFGFSVSFSPYNRIPYSYWNFVPYQYITYRSVYRHRVPATTVTTIINNTTYVTNKRVERSGTFFIGPSPKEIEGKTRKPVRVYNVDNGGNPGRTRVQREAVTIYKPEIDNSHASRSRARPSQYVSQDARKRMERSGPQGTESQRYKPDRKSDRPTRYTPSGRKEEMGRKDAPGNRDRGPERREMQKGPSKEQGGRSGRDDGKTRGKDKSSKENDKSRKKPH